MQTNGYSLALLTGEQQNARRILGQLVQCLHNGAWTAHEEIDLDWFVAAFNKLLMIDRYCHERKIERHVIPAIRHACTDADALLDRLDTLSVEALRILRYAYNQIRRAVDGGDVDPEMLIAAMELYCLRMLERLALEEDELFPVARRVLSHDEWFRLAARSPAAPPIPCALIRAPISQPAEKRRKT
ncbi:MAG: hypothetical protein ACM3WS_01215 [Bacillota bacterium]